MKRAITLLFLCLFCFTISAQRKRTTLKRKNPEFSKLFRLYYLPGPWSITAGAGFAAYRGNICVLPECNNLQLAYNLGFNYKPWPYIVVGAEINYFNLSANMANEYVKINFNSTNADFRVYGRFNLFEEKLALGRSKNQSKVRFNMFITAGVSAVYFNPITDIRTFRRIEEDNLQNKTSSGYTVGFPFGGGISYKFNSRFTIVGESVFTPTLTDLLENHLRIENRFFRDSYGIASLKFQIAF